MISQTLQESGRIKIGLHNKAKEENKWSRTGHSAQIADLSDGKKTCTSLSMMAVFSTHEGWHFPCLSRDFKNWVHLARPRGAVDECHIDSLVETASLFVAGTQP